MNEYRDEEEMPLFTGFLIVLCVLLAASTGVLLYERWQDKGECCPKGCYSTCVEMTKDEK